MFIPFAVSFAPVNVLPIPETFAKTFPDCPKILPTAEVPIAAPATPPKTSIPAFTGWPVTAFFLVLPIPLAIAPTPAIAVPTAAKGGHAIPASLTIPPAVSKTLPNLRLKTSNLEFPVALNIG